MTPLKLIRPIEASRIAESRASGSRPPVIRCAAVLRQTAEVADGSRAGSLYELCEPVPARRNIVEWVVLLFDAVQGTVSAQPPMEHRVKVRTTGEVVYRVKIDSNPAFNEARSSIARDLDQLTIDDFNEQYGLKIRLKGVT